MEVTKFQLCAAVALLFVAFANASILKPALFADDSCVGRCNSSLVPDAPCQCNSACIRFNDCCPDYASLCLPQAGSCVGRCNQTGTVPGTCQCNKPCVEFGDCCPDYSDVCQPTDGVSDQELRDLGEELLALDVDNNVAQFISVDLQGKTSSGSTADLAPNPLLTVQSGAYSTLTNQLLVALLDNYNPDVNIGDAYSDAELAEVNAFLDAVFDTPIMQRTQEFLQAKNLPSGRDNFFTLWFGLYSRGSGPLGSSGFEHVFIGELKNGVSGFHGWQNFGREEAISTTQLNYRGWMDFIDLGAKGSIIEHNFQWRSQNKPISSMFIGTSPELELSIYTVCWHARPNAKCPVSLGGNQIGIQTYTIGSSSQFVASAYPDLSP